MDMMTLLSLLSPLDLIAVGGLVLCWAVVGYLIERPNGRRPSVTILMSEYRREWMREFVTRDVRIFDSQIVGSLRQGTAFFASTCLLAIGGVLALIGNVAPLEGVAEGLTQVQRPELVWQVKLMLVALFLTHGFLKFVWANRIFGYCSVMMAAVPTDPANPKSAPRAAMAAELNIRAAWNFNRGLRSMYFALGALAWLLGAVPLMVATGIVVWSVWSREFASSARKIVLSDDG
jgi:uncharacterized membrane protein